jgi:hypothetical protein
MMGFAALYPSYIFAVFDSVIPGRCEASNPESISPPTLPPNGFRVRAKARPG